VTHLSKGDPPFLIIHGTDDSVVPHAQSQALHSAANGNGVHSKLHLIRGAKHGFHLEPSQRDLKPLVADFLDQHLE
jgi:dipeptidyl aminopeptidase/acylaminoacyl peptidase